MKTILEKYIQFEIEKKELHEIFGEDLFNVDIKPFIVFPNHIILALKKFYNAEITVEQLTEWTNVVWFTDLFDYSEIYSNSISSVMTVLETLDEDDVELSKKDINKMINCLESNTEYDRK